LRQKQRTAKGPHHARKAEKQEDVETDLESGIMFATMIGLKEDTRGDGCIIDSGASRHMTFEINILRDNEEFGTNRTW